MFEKPETLFPRLVKISLVKINLVKISMVKINGIHRKAFFCYADFAMLAFPRPCSLGGFSRKIFRFLPLAASALLCLLSLEASALALSQDYVLKRALSASPFLAKIKAQKRQTISELAFQKLSPYEWKAFFSAGKTYKKNPAISPFDPAREEALLYSFGFEKKLPFGLSLKSAYTDSLRDAENSELLRRFQVPGATYRKNLSLELSMDLLQNIFGLEEKRFFARIDTGSRIANWKYLEEAEGLALKAAGQYWKVRIARAAFLQTERGLRAYSQLERQIRKKKKYHFLRPGEEPQVLAEYESLKRELDWKKQAYQDELKRLFVILKTRPEPEMESLVFSDPAPKPPAAIAPFRAENLRPVKILEERIKERELGWKTARSSLWPALRLQTKAGWFSGGAEGSRSGFFPERKPFYELSLSFLYPLFSKAAREKAKSEGYKLEESRIDLEIFKREIRHQIDSLGSKVIISWKSFQRAEKANKHQKRAFLELKRAFSQGRADIFELMRAEGKLRESEISLEIARSERCLFELERKAFLDQLAESYL